MASGQPHENRPKDRRKLWLWAGVFLLVASAIFWVRVLIAVIAVKGGEMWYIISPPFTLICLPVAHPRRWLSGRGDGNRLAYLFLVAKKNPPAQLSNGLGRRTGFHYVEVTLRRRFS
jgi:hypothetical protein